jgi:hypothetical protein
MAWSLGYLDSNQEMTESESVALPFGDSPMFCNEDDYKREYTKMQAFFYFFAFPLFCPFLLSRHESPIRENTGQLFTNLQANAL